MLFFIVFLWLIYKTAAKTFSGLLREGGAQRDDLEQSQGCSRIRSPIRSRIRSRVRF